MFGATLAHRINARELGNGMWRFRTIENRGGSAWLTCLETPSNVPHSPILGAWVYVVCEAQTEIGTVSQKLRRQFQGIVPSAERTDLQQQPRAIAPKPLKKGLVRREQLKHL